MLVEQRIARGSGRAQQFAMLRSLLHQHFPCDTVGEDHAQKLPVARVLAVGNGFDH